MGIGVVIVAVVVVVAVKGTVVGVLILIVIIIISIIIIVTVTVERKLEDIFKYFFEKWPFPSFRIIKKPTNKILKRKIKYCATFSYQIQFEVPLVPRQNLTTDKKMKQWYKSCTSRKFKKISVTRVYSWWALCAVFPVASNAAILNPLLLVKVFVCHLVRRTHKNRERFITHASSFIT